MKALVAAAQSLVFRSFGIPCLSFLSTVQRLTHVRPKIQLGSLAASIESLVDQSSLDLSSKCKHNPELEHKLYALVCGIKRLTLHSLVSIERGYCVSTMDSSFRVCKVYLVYQRGLINKP